MQPGSDKFLAKAVRAARAAEAALEHGATDLAAGRALAAMLHAAKALLNERGLRLRTHARIAAALAVQAPVRGAAAEWLGEALAMRQRLSAGGELEYAAVERLVEQAAAFVAGAQRHIEPRE